MKYLVIFLSLLFITSCSLNRPVAVTTELYGNKEGIVCERGWLFFPPALGQEKGIEAAKKQGNITKVSSVEHQINIKFLFNDFCTIVRGS